MKRVEIERGFILVSLIFISVFSVLIFTSPGSITGYFVSELNYNMDSVDVLSHSFNVEVEGIKSVFIPGEKKPLDVSVKNDGPRTVHSCHIRGSGGGSFESDLVVDIHSGETIDYPLVIEVDDEFPKVWLECEEGKRDININFIIYTLDVSAEILNVNFRENNLVINYRVTTDVDFSDSITVRITDNFGNIVRSVEKQIVCMKGNSVDEQIMVELDSDDEGLLNVAIMQGSAVLVEDTVIYGKDVIDVTGNSVWEVYSDGTYTYILVMVLVFVFVAFFVVMKIVRNVHSKKGKA